MINFYAINMNIKKLKTYKQLFDYTLSDEKFNVHTFLQKLKTSVQRGQFQEALFNIYYYMYEMTVNEQICIGNFSKGCALSVPFSKRKFMKSKIIQGGDKSDLTIVDHKNNKIIATTSKYKTKETMKDFYDVVAICSDFDKYKETEYKGYSLNIFIVCRSFDDFKLSFDRANTSSNLDHKKALIDDYYDLNDIQEFIDQYKIDIKKETNGLGNIDLRFGQRIICESIRKKLNNGETTIINSSICRFGKSYCMAKDILNITEDSKDAPNFILITTQPKTIESLEKLFTYDEFQKYEIFNFKNKHEITDFITCDTKDKQIITIVSLQMLRGYFNTSGSIKPKKKPIVKKIKELKFVSIIDEFHEGGKTELSKTTLTGCGLMNKNSIKIFYSATYDKISEGYLIPDSNIIGWNICDNISAGEYDIKTLSNKYGEKLVTDIAELYTEKTITDHYGSLPKIKFFINTPTNECIDEFKKINNVDDQFENTGYSFDAVKMIESDGSDDGFKLVNERAMVSYMQTILGKRNNVHNDIFVTDNKFTCMLDHYYKSCNSINQRTRYKEKYPLIIPFYIHDGKIQGVYDKKKNNKTTLSYKTSLLMIECIKKYKSHFRYDVDEFKFVAYNSATRGGVCTSKNQSIEDGFDELVKKNKNKKAIFLFLGDSLTTGITNKYCDAIKLTRPIKSFDRFWQTTCRAFNEAKDKYYAMIFMDGYQSSGSILDLVNHLRKPGESEKQSWCRIYQNIFDIHECDSNSGYVKTIETDNSDIYWKVKNNTSFNTTVHKFVRNIRIANNTTRELVLKLDVKLNEKAKKEIAKIEKLLDNKRDDLKKGIDVDKQVDIDALENRREKIREKNAMESYYIMLEVFITVSNILTLQFDNVNIENMFDLLNNQTIDNVSLYDILLEHCSIAFATNYDDTMTKVAILFNVLEEKGNVAYINEQLEFLRRQIKLGNINDLYSSICNNIKTTTIERKNNAEVLTPIHTVEEMLDLIPVDFWHSPKTVFDPCVGKGAFITIVFNKFMEGMAKTIPDENKRRKIIIEECIYFADINTLNIYISKFLLDPKCDYKLNYFLGDSLNLDIKKEFKLDTFDLIVGNPPYSTDPSLSGNKPLYNVFITNYIDKCNHFIFIIPSRWFAGGKGLHIFRRMMLARKDIKSIKHFDNASDIFADVCIKGGVNYFYKTNDYTGLCDFNNTMVDMSKYDILPKPIYIPIIDRVKHLPSISSIYTPSGYYKINTNDKRFTDEKKNNICLVSKLKSKDRHKFIELKVPDTKKFWKVITTEAAHKAFSGFGYINVSCPDEIYSQSYISFKTNDEDESKNLASYLKTKPINFILSSRKISQHINTSVIKWIPLPDITRPWTDDDVYNWLNFSQNEIDTVEEMF